jgi:hypothetical protein
MMFKIGTLVKKTTRHGNIRHGLVVGWEASGGWVEIAWIGGITSYDAVTSLEVVSESR